MLAPAPETRDPDTLVRDYYNFALWVARDVSRGHPDNAEIQGSALEALVKLSRSYDPAKGASFATYLRPRLRWAIADSARSYNGRRQGADGPRSTQVSQTNDTFALHLDKPLRSGWDDHGNPMTLGDTLAAPDDPAAEVIEAMTLQEVREAVTHLSDAERYVIEQTAFAHRTLAAIGADLGVTESRICQIRRRAIEHLQERLVPDAHAERMDS